MSGERRVASSKYTHESGGYESEGYESEADMEDWDGGTAGEELHRPRRRTSLEEIVQPPPSQMQPLSPQTPQQPSACTDEAVGICPSCGDGGGGVDVGQYDGSLPEAQQPSTASSGVFVFYTSEPLPIGVVALPLRAPVQTWTSTCDILVLAPLRTK
ncbi:hypothetical protein VaNZ11_008261 [Volvox africanus]|uniref:Uncharacterized protein n=1 Tax=Volvox africanus TaxID=51714 RepID=A0ABQ5S507_9CHLO|nr:hypothetical protein VaNZ11_008261 [Volvox africanus]